MASVCLKSGEQNLLTSPDHDVGHGTIEQLLRTRIGAVDFLEKPIALQKLLNAVAKQSC